MVRRLRLHQQRPKRQGQNCPASLFAGLLVLLLPVPVVLAMGGPACAAQTAIISQPLPPGPPRAWVDAAALNQEHIINEDGAVPLRYRIRKVDAKGSTTREVIESREGNVARLIERNGAPLTVAEDTAERARLQDILQSPSTFLSHKQRDRAARSYALELVRNMPKAMIWTYAPGQPQLPNLRTPQVVIDFTPDPHFKSPSLVTDGLTGIAGRIWIDARTRCVTRIQGSFLHPVDFGWGGILARINQGGTVEFEQAALSDRRWLYSYLSEHLTVREVLVHTVRENTVMDASDPHLLPQPISYREAIHALLAMQVPTR